MDTEDRTGLPTVAERVQWLFEVAITRGPPLGAAGGASAARRWTTLEVALVLAKGLHRGAGSGISIWVQRVEQLRTGAGNGVRGSELVGLADFFGISPDYFGDDPQQVITAQEEFTGRALRECGVLTYRRCPRMFLRSDSLKLFTVEGLACHDQVDKGELTSACAETSGTPGGAMDGSGLSIQLPRDRPMTTSALRELCSLLLTELSLVPPLTPQRLAERLAAVRKRRINLRAAELFTTASVGHLVVKSHRDVIGYHRSATPYQQAQVIYHELMHLVLGHVTDMNSLTCGALEEDIDLQNGWSNEDGLYAQWQEWEAETAATVLSGMSLQRISPRMLGKDASAADRGIAGIFGLTDGGWR